MNLKVSKLRKEQKEKVYNLIEEKYDAHSLRDEIGKCPHVGVYLKLCNEQPFFVDP